LKNDPPPRPGRAIPGRTDRRAYAEPGGSTKKPEICRSASHTTRPVQSPRERHRHVERRAERVEPLVQEVIECRDGEGRGVGDRALN
jgi:hypothetical protein